MTRETSAAQQLIKFWGSMMEPTLTLPTQTRWRIGIVFCLLVVAVIALFMIPAWIIQPFKYQSPRALSLSLAVRQIAPWGSALATALALFLAWKLWRHVGLWKKALLALGLCLTIAAAAMTRIDYFEWMFHPVAAPGFEAASESKLDSGQMVMAVRIGGDARAYPIRAMAYHHVVNDVVHGIPIVVTY
jgi:hypothetical protein